MGFGWQEMSVCLSRLIVKSHYMGRVAESKKPKHSWGGACVESSIPFFSQNNKALLFMKKASRNLTLTLQLSMN